MINFLNLQYFLVLCEEMNFRKASQKLFITQQSLSGHIQKLEEYFGVPLFDRNSPLSLTPAGLHLKKKAASLLEMENNLQKELLDISGFIGGSLTVGSTDARTQCLLPSVLSSFHEQYPSVSIRLFEGNSSELEEALRNGRLDVSIGFYPSDTSQITSIPLYEEHFQVVLPRQIVWRFVPHISPKASLLDFPSVLSCLKSCPFITMTPDTKIAAFNQQYFKKLGITPNIFLETKNIGSLLSFCQAGLGISIFPETFIKYSPFDFSKHYFYRIEDMDNLNAIVINYRNSKYQSQTIQAFISIVREVLSRTL